MSTTEDATKALAIRYLHRTPRSVTAGRVLVHNHVRRYIDHPVGASGFRAWTQRPSRTLAKCSCGWAGLPHYRICAIPGSRALPGRWADAEARRLKAFMRKRKAQLDGARDGGATIETVQAATPRGGPC